MQLPNVQRPEPVPDAPLDRLPVRGSYVFSNVAATLRDWLFPAALVFLLLVALVGLGLALATQNAAFFLAPAFPLLVAALAIYAVVIAHGFVTGLRFARCRRISRGLGLKTLVLVPLHPKLAIRLYGSDLPRSARAVVEVHVDSSARWWSRADPPELRAWRAAVRFLEALHADYARIVRDLLPASADWAFAVSTWHRLPDWLPDYMARSEHAGLAIVHPGPVPVWLAKVGEGHRKRAQRRMFGKLLGRPVNDPRRWTSYFLAPAWDRIQSLHVATAADAGSVHNPGRPGAGVGRP